VQVSSLRAEGKERFVWAMDMTPSVNITRALFKVESNGKACAVLYAPMSSSLELQLTAEGELPSQVEAQDTPPPGFDANRVVYRLVPGTHNYAPAACFKVNSAGRARSVDCCEAHLD
jgi:hypothetical protein